MCTQLRVHHHLYWDLTAGWMCCFPEPDAEGRTEPEVQGPPNLPSPLKSLFRRMSDRLVRQDLNSPIPSGYTSLPSSPPSSPTSRPSPPCSSWRLQVAGLCRKLELSDPALATTPQTQPPSTNPVLKPTSPNDPHLSPTLPCPQLRSSLSPRSLFLGTLTSSTSISPTMTRPHPPYWLLTAYFSLRCYHPLPVLVKFPCQVLFFVPVCKNTQHWEDR